MRKLKALLIGAPPSDAVHAEIIRSLYGNFIPVIYAALALITVGCLTIAITRDIYAVALTIMGALVALIRLIVISSYLKEQAALGFIPRKRAELWEQRYTVWGTITALIIGFIAARNIALGNAACTVMGLGLAFGFGAGVVARGSLNPFIALLNLSAAGIPPIVASLFQGDVQYVGVAVFMTMYLISSFQLVQVTYRSSVELITLKQQFEQQSRLDPLTGLFNRSMQNSELIRKPLPGKKTISAVYAIDLDRFKDANDRFGHMIGDMLLKMVAVRLNATTHDNDVVMRMGGDEFIIVQNELEGRENAEQMAQCLIETICAPYRIDEYDVEIGVSIGVALTPDDGKTTEGLLARADAALYRAKERRNTYVFADAARMIAKDDGIYSVNKAARAA